MSISRRMLVLVLAVSAAWALVGCAGLPQSGQVHVGLTMDGENAGHEASIFLPEGPEPEATPEQIVTGFLRAGSGTADTWATAQQFLTEGFRTAWQPTTSVIVDRPGAQRTYKSDDAGNVTVTLSPLAIVDAAGTYEATEVGPTTLNFSLIQVDGQWRIQDAPDGIVLDNSVFLRVFDQYQLMYFDPSLQFLVPDVRWFTRSNAPARIALALIEGEPSDWLAEAVEDSFPDAVAMSSPSVTVSSVGVAEVGLSDDALSLDRDTLNRMQTQLAASLSTAGVSETRMLFGTTVLDATTIPMRSTRVAAQPVVQTAEGFGALNNGKLEPIPGISEAIANLDATAVVISGTRDVAAVQTSNHAVSRVQDDGSVTVVDQRAGLIAPSLDPFGFVWTVPANKPSALEASTARGRVSVAESWLVATGVRAIAVSRDGSRIAAVISEGDRSALWVASVVRDENRAPTRLGQLVRLATVVGGEHSVAWLDEITIGVLAGSGDDRILTEQVIGGQMTSVDVPSKSVSLAGSTSSSSVHLLGTDNTLYTQRGQTWLESKSGVTLLATQQGIPEP